MSEGLFRWTGALSQLSASDRQELLQRAEADDDAIARRTADIISRVRLEGDAALLAMARELDGVQLDSLEVPRERWKAASDGLDPALARALKHARNNIEVAHVAFRPQTVEVETEPGVRVGRRPDPLTRVGIYAPGGRAAYPSSVLMAAVAAKVAGVPELILCSPPGSSKMPAPAVLAAAEIAGVNRVFAVGGAGAVAAMAYGTKTIPRVDRIVGPGNAYVLEAKLQVSRSVGIDSPAGPSELLAISDLSSDNDAVARELLAQAEHDPRAAVVALALGAEAAGRIERSVTTQVGKARRTEIIRASLRERSAVLSVASLDEAIEFSNEFAPEHILLALRNPNEVLKKLRHAGTVFLGASSSVAFGDYISGSNHVLPTGGLARLYSGLSTHDFVRWTSYQEITPAAAARLAPDVEVLAEAEGLFAHAQAARAWRMP